MAKLKIKHLQSNVYTTNGGGTARAANVIVDAGFPKAANSQQFSTIGIVGGANGLGAPSNTTGNSNVVLCYANINYGNSTNPSYAAGDAYLVRQKGTHKFQVANLATPGRQSTCVLANVPFVDNGNVGVPNTTAIVANLTSNTMAIFATPAYANGDPDYGNIVPLYTITDKHVVGFPTDYANANSQGNLATATQFYGSYGNANANVQSGPGSNGTGLYTIVDVSNQA